MIRPLSRLWFARFVIPALGDLAILCAALALSFGLREPQLLRADVFRSFMPLFALWIATFYAAGLYELRLVRDFVLLVGGLLFSGVTCWVLGTTYFYFTSPYLALTPKTHLAVALALSHLGMLGWRRAILGLTDYSLMRLRLLVLASEEHIAHLRASINQRSGEGLDLAASLGPDVDLVVADAGWLEGHWEESRRIFSAAVSRGVPIVSLDNFYESLFGKVSPLYANDPAWALEHVLPHADGVYFKARRAVDYAAAAAGLVLLSPVLALVAALIRVVDGMPPFYGQLRVGYLGRSFVLWKFRTMRPRSDEEGPFVRRAEESDSRVTPLGRFLRRFRLDEFPQLWNVVRGEMSLVGPRPEWVKEVEILERVVPNYHLRHLVPPGITGWAQVYYRATNDPKDSIEKHHFDLYYLKNFSPALELSILLKTMKRVFVKDTRVSSAHTPFPRAARSVAFPVDIASIISRN
ncbi:MAG: sugar transferase [Elusimicrobia bacterium]|nr:sugar transferase [Elusimicrobiota bacterium]